MLTLQRQDAVNRDRTLAWWIAALALKGWSSRLPDLQGLLSTGRTARPQTLAEQKAALDIIAQRLGRPLQKRSHAR